MNTNQAGVAARERPIGVFDSGIGGLTVVSALRALLPNETIHYLGDTARVPYGGRSAATVERYSLEITAMLLEENCKAIVVACNTASALALATLESTTPVPVIGVIRPGAEAAVAATRNGHIGVIGTRATIKSGAYERAIRALDPALRVSARACPLFVPLIEEGWLAGATTEAVVRQYLQPLVAGRDRHACARLHALPALARNHRRVPRGNRAAGRLGRELRPGRLAVAGRR